MKVHQRVRPALRCRMLKGFRRIETLDRMLHQRSGVVVAPAISQEFLALPSQRKAYPKQVKRTLAATRPLLPAQGLSESGQTA